MRRAICFSPRPFAGIAGLQATSRVISRWISLYRLNGYRVGEGSARLKRDLEAGTKARACRSASRFPGRNRLEQAATLPALGRRVYRPGHAQRFAEIAASIRSVDRGAYFGAAPAWRLETADAPSGR